MGLAIFIITIITMVASLLLFPTINIKKHKIETYWVIVFIGSLLMIITSTVELPTLWSSLTTSSGMNPIKLVILFISMTVLSIFLDEIGFFKWLALYMVRQIKGKQTTLFLLIYLMVSVLTIFTSNDVIILTFTPLIGYFAKAAKIKPLPYLFGILTAANTWSITLIIGNPTNIYLAVNQGIDFMTYFKIMWFPGLVAGITGLIMVYLIFRRDLTTPMTTINEEAKLKDRFLTILGLIFILATIVLLAISNFINIEMWFITLIMAILLTLISSTYLLIKRKKLNSVLDTYKKAPWTFIPLILGMFILLEGIKQGSYIDQIVTILDNGNPVINYGVASYLFSNLMNNQPMSMLFSVILYNSSSLNIEAATYASIIGSNLGVLLTPLGALAGLMWMNLLEKQDIKLSFFGYIKKCFLIGIVTLIFSLGALLIII